MLIHFGNVNIKEVGFNKAYFNYKIMGLSDRTFDYQYLLPILQKAAPSKANKIGKTDISLTQTEQFLLRQFIEEELEKMLADRKPEEDEGGLVRFVLGRRVGLHLKGNPKDQRLSTFITLHSIIEDCLKGEKPMYIGVEEQS